MSDRNKILILHASNAYGGAECSLLEFLNNLHGSPVEIHIILSSRFAKRLKEQVNVPVHFHDFELRYFRKHQNIRRYWQLFICFIVTNYKIFRLVKKQKIQTVYCNTFRSLPYCLAIKLSGRARVVCHCRDQVSSPFIKYLIRSGSNRIVAVSAAIKKQISPDDTVRVIHNGVNTASLSGISPTGWLHKELHLSPNTKLIGNIGQIVPWKNQTDYLLIAWELLKKNPGLHFLLIGGFTDDRYFSLLKHQLDSLHLTPYFTLTGPVRDIKKYLGELDILIHTAVDEPFGRVIIEAAAASKPVVAYDSGGPSEIIRNGETGFLVPCRDTDKMLECTLSLLADRSLRESVGRSAQRHIARHFNSKDYANKLYNTLIHD